jgi:hypothetical protein
MRAIEPPALPTWLLARLLVGQHRDALVGDLVEEYRRGRSSLWYWRQSLIAIVTASTEGAWRHAGLTLGTVLVGVALPRLFVTVNRWLGWRWNLWLYSWYRPTVIWLFRHDFDAAVPLVPQGLTGVADYCVLLAAAAWTMSRWRPQQRGLVATTLMLMEFGARAPVLAGTLGNWLHAPTNEIAFSGAFWYAIWTFVAVPASILAGSSSGAKSAVQ